MSQRTVVQVPAGMGLWSSRNQTTGACGAKVTVGMAGERVAVGGTGVLVGGGGVLVGRGVSVGEGVFVGGGAQI